MELPEVELRPFSGAPSLRHWFADEVGGEFVGGFYAYDEMGRSYEPWSGCYLATINDEPVALVATYEDGPRTWINPLVVAPDHRGRGIGRATLQRLIGDGLIRGEIRCDIERENVSSMKCFAALGFVENEWSTDDAARMAFSC